MTTKENRNEERQNGRKGIKKHKCEKEKKTKCKKDTKNIQNRMKKYKRK